MGTYTSLLRAQKVKVIKVHSSEQSGIKLLLMINQVAIMGPFRASERLVGSPILRPEQQVGLVSRDQS